MQLTRSTLIATLLLAALSACGDKSGKTDKADAEAKPATLADATAPKAVAAAQQLASRAALPKADRNTPDSQYMALDSGNQLMFSYLSLAAMPIDYKDVATNFSPDYARAADEFRRNDLLTALKPRIDAAVAEAGQRRYVKMTIDNPIEKYDFDKKGFPLSSAVWQSGSYRYFFDNSNYKIGFTNGDAFRYLSTATEDSARNIEGLRSKNEQLQLVVYAYTQQADLTDKIVKGEIVKVTLLDAKGNVLASSK